MFVSAVVAVAVVRSGAGSWRHAEAGTVVAEPELIVESAAAREPDAPVETGHADTGRGALAGADPCV